MRFKFYFFAYLLSCLIFTNLNAQLIAEKLVYTTKRVSTAPQIDGVLDDAIWTNNQIATDFVQIEPEPGITSPFKSEVQLVYDDNSIYIAANLLNEPDPMQGLAERDGFGNASWFAFIVDAYESEAAGLEFFVTAAGVQNDAQFDISGEDFNWNAVWKSAVKINDEGWTVEMEIPYSALRFPNKEVQEWNINFGRMSRKTRQKSFWNEVNPAIDGFMNQSGKLKGIENIKTPVRLSFTPYFSAALNHFPENNQLKKDLDPVFNAGMDIKYGINDAFTLDMTLVPDFSQTVSDEFVLNLGPFEVRYDENRQFFTEGVDLFNKSGLFYSRRIGGLPIAYWDAENEVGNNEEMISNPSANQLINATKISGRTDKGLGVAIFNAVEAQTHAIIRDTETGEERTVKTSPFVNYNVVVLDQNLEGNAYVTLTNTNVNRFGSQFYDANVTGVNGRFTTKSNKYALTVEGVLSQKMEGDFDETELGFKYGLDFSKVSGKFIYGAGTGVESHKYDPNDLGFLFSPNEKVYYAYAGINQFKPVWRFNRISGRINAFYERLYEPDKFTNFGIRLNYWSNTKKFLAQGQWVNIEPIVTFDFFEPRTADFSRYYRYPINASFGGFFSSDYSKKFAIDINYNFRKFNQSKRFNVGYRIAPRWQPNTHWLIVPYYNFNYNQMQEGFVESNFETDGNILFGRRNVFTNIYGLNIDYAINNTMTVKLQSRHNWSRTRYQSLGILNQNGEVDESLIIGDYDQTAYNVNFNALTIDLGYTWVFAPGSELSVLWKNIILGNDFNLTDSYSNNLKNTLQADQNNSVSFKILYYIDYLYFNKWFNRNKKA